MPAPRNKSQVAAQPTVPDDLLVLTEEQAARLIGLSKFTLHRMRTDPEKYGAGPKHLQLSTRRIGYRRAALEDWLRAQEVG
jgi:predicted DNA-binding transcriptional regulator AlpA